jgi:hypothetical protein
MQISQVRSTMSPEKSIPSTSGERRQNRRSTTNEHLAFRYDPTVNYTGDKLVDFGTINKICQYCNALRF